jgi:hypothetical protein
LDDWVHRSSDGHHDSEVGGESDPATKAKALVSAMLALVPHSYSAAHSDGEAGE